MFMTKLIIAFICCYFLSYSILNSQNYPEIIFDTENSIGCNRIQEDINGDYILCCSEGKTDSIYQSWGRIIKCTSDFDIQSTIIEYPDTDLYFEDFVITDLNNYIVIGGHGFDEGWYYKCRNLIICIFNENLELLYQNIIPLPEGYFNPKMYLCKAGNGIIFGAGYAWFLGYQHFFMIKFNENGEILQSSYPDYPLYDFTHRIVGISDFNYSSNRFIALGRSFAYNSSIQAVEIDTNLNYSITQYYTNPNGYSFSSTATALWFNDSIYLFSSADNPTNNKPDNRDLFISQINKSHEFIGEPLWTGRQDTVDILGEYGMDFYTPNNIFVAGHTMQGGQAQWEYNYFIGLIDGNLNVKGTKRIGQPNINYFFSTLCATSDGGCVFVSTRNDYLNTPQYDWDLHIIKLFPDDIITTLPSTILQLESEYRIFPNPGGEQIYIETYNKGVYVQIFNDIGKLIFEQKLDNQFTTKINTLQMPSGTYIYNIVDDNGLKEEGIWIKK